MADLTETRTVTINARVALVLAQYVGHLLRKEFSQEDGRDPVLAVFHLAGFDQPAILGREEIAETRAILDAAYRELLGIK